MFILARLFLRSQDCTQDCTQNPDASLSALLQQVSKSTLSWRVTNKKTLAYLGNSKCIEAVCTVSHLGKQLTRTLDHLIYIQGNGQVTKEMTINPNQEVQHLQFTPPNTNDIVLCFSPELPSQNSLTQPCGRAYTQQ